MKNLKKGKEWHASSSKSGSGDYYGSAIKQKVGRAKDIMLESPLKPKKMKPPKSLA